MTLYLSFDVETTGAVPGLHRMLSLGVAPYLDPSTTYTGTKGYHEMVALDNRFEVTFQVPKPTKSVTAYQKNDAVWDASTWEFWCRHENKEAFAQVVQSKAAVSNADGMEQFRKYMNKLTMKYGMHAHVWVAYPASFDMPWLRYYASRYIPHSWKSMYPASFIMEGIACLDIGTLAMTLLGRPYEDIRSRDLPWSPKKDVWSKFGPEHTALSDAVRQGELFRNMMMAFWTWRRTGTIRKDINND